MVLKTDVEVVKPLKGNKNVKDFENAMYKNKIQLDGEANLGLPSIPKLEKGGVFNAFNGCTL